MVVVAAVVDAEPETVHVRWYRLINDAAARALGFERGCRCFRRRRLTRRELRLHGRRLDVGGRYGSLLHRWGGRGVAGRDARRHRGHWLILACCLPRRALIGWLIRCLRCAPRRLCCVLRAHLPHRSFGGHGRLVASPLRDQMRLGRLILRRRAPCDLVALECRGRMSLAMLGHRRYGRCRLAKRNLRLQSRGMGIIGQFPGACEAMEGAWGRWSNVERSYGLSISAAAPLTRRQTWAPPNLYRRVSSLRGRGVVPASQTRTRAAVQCKGMSDPRYPRPSVFGKRPSQPST